MSYSFLRLSMIFILLCSVASKTHAAPPSPFLRMNSPVGINFGTVAKDYTTTVVSPVSPAVSLSGSVVITDDSNNNNTIAIRVENCNGALNVKDYTLHYGGNTWSVPGYSGAYHGPLPQARTSGKTLSFTAYIEIPPGTTLGTKTACTRISAKYLPAFGSSNPSRNITHTVVVAGAPMQLNETNPLNFGKILKPTVSGTVKIDTSSSRTVTGGVTLVNGGTIQAGTFDLKVSENSVNISALGNAASGGLSLSNFVLKAPNGNNYNLSNVNTSVPTNAGANSALILGATLNVANTVTSGVKSVGYTITFTYQ